MIVVLRHDTTVIVSIRAVMRVDTLELGYEICEILRPFVLYAAAITAFGR